jgi:hypothetical protein
MTKIVDKREFNKTTISKVEIGQFFEFIKDKENHGVCLKTKKDDNYSGDSSYFSFNENTGWYTEDSNIPVRILKVSLHLND